MGLRRAQAEEEGDEAEDVGEQRAQCREQRVHDPRADVGEGPLREVGAAGEDGATAVPCHAREEEDEEGAAHPEQVGCEVDGDGQGEERL